MDKTTDTQMAAAPKAPRKSMQYYARALHRVLGYLAVGLVIVFSMSGVILVHRTGNFMKSAEPVETTVASNLDEEQLASALKMKKLGNAVTEDGMIRFADGEYNVATGQVSYVKREVVPPFSSFISLHKISDGKDRGVAVLVTIFGVVLFLLPVSALFMYKPSARQFRRNMVYTLLGIVLAIVLVCIV